MSSACSANKALVSFDIGVGSRFDLAHSITPLSLDAQLG